MPFIIVIVTMGPGFVLDAVALCGLYISLAYTLPVLPPIRLPIHIMPNGYISMNVLIELIYSIDAPLETANSKLVTGVSVSFF